MTDSDQKLDFSLPARNQSPPSGGKGARLLLGVVAVLSAANLAILLGRGSGPAPSSPARAQAQTGDNLSSDARRELALKLEGQGLQSVAARAWIDYLEVAAADPKDASAIWYRIGKLHQEAGKFDAALDAYYRCESLDPESPLRDEIGRRAQESLEAMGKFAALKQELASRVSMDGSGGDDGEEVIAEIGPRKITRTELDQQIEANIENQLARFAARMPEAQRKQQKEAMLKQFSTDAQRMQFLQSFVVQEILYRKARESKLIDNPGVRAQLQDMERGLLAQQMMATEVEGKLHITDGDLATYYEANRAGFVDPESAQVSRIVVEDQGKAEALAEELKDADAAVFAERAKEVSMDDATRGNGGELASPIVKGRPAPPGFDAASVQAVFETAPGKLLPDLVESEGGVALVFVRSRQAERQKSFEEVRDRVYQELRQRKEREVEQQLMERLRDEYNVVIHHSKFKQAEGGE